MPQELAKKIRNKYPGEYDDIDDIELERRIIAKHPEYEDLASEEARRPISTKTSQPPGDLTRLITGEKPEPSLLERATSPLTTIPSEFARSISQYMDIPTKEGRVHPLAAFGAGAVEGLGDVISSLTSPADLAATVLGFGAYGAAGKGLKRTAEALRRGTQAVSALPVVHGAKTAVDTDKTAAERASGIAEAAGGAAGVHFPKSALAQPAKQAVGDIVKLMGRDFEVIGFGPDGKPKLALTKKSASDMVPDESAADVSSLKMAEEIDPEVQKTKDIIAELFPEESKNTPRFKMSGEGAETFYPGPRPDARRRAAEQIKSFVDDESGELNLDALKKRYYELFDKEIDGTLTSDELAEATKLNRQLRDVNFGDVDPNYTPSPEVAQLRGALTDLKDLMNVKHPTQTDLNRLDTLRDKMQNFNVPHPDEINVGEIPKREIDLNEAALEAGADTARPVGRGISEGIRNFLGDESGEFNPDFYNQPGRSEFSPDLRQVDEPEFGGTSPRFQPRTSVPEETSISLGDRIRNFMSDESGEFNVGGRLIKKYDIQGREIKPKTEDDLIAELTNQMMEATNRERDVALKSGQVEATPEQTQAIFNQPEQALTETPKAEIPLLRSKNYLKNFMQDESGEMNLGGFEREIPREQRPLPLLKGKEDLLPGKPITERQARTYEEPSTARELYDLPVGLMSVDAPFMTSAAFRQASPLAFTKDWFKAWGAAAKSYGSQKAYDALEAEIKNSKYFKSRYKPHYNAKGEIIKYKEVPSIAEEAGVKLTDFSHFSNREEMIRSRLAEKLPGYGRIIKASNRSYAGFLNSLRKAKFEQLVDQADWAYGSKDESKLKDIAEFINNATGRASLGKLEPAANALSTALWSPRLLASRIKMATSIFKPSVDPKVRMEYIKGMTRSIGTWWGFAGLAGLAGASVNTDPTNADFGKIKIGNTRIDPGSGFQQLLVLGARLAPQMEANLMPDTEVGGMDFTGETRTGQFTSSSSGKTTQYGAGGPFEKTRGDVAFDFAKSKMHPAARFALDLLSASKGRPVHVTDEIAQMMLPMMAQDIMEAMKEDPSLAAAMVPLSSMGFGTSTYGRTKEFNAPVFTDSIEEYLNLEPRSLAGTIR